MVRVLDLAAGNVLTHHVAVTWYLHTAHTNAHVLMPGRWHAPLESPATIGHELAFATQADAVRWCEAERANLVAATQQAADSGEHTTAWKLPAILLSFFWLRKHWADWMTTHQTGLAAAQQLNDPLAKAWILTCLGAAYHDVGRISEALSCYRPALDHWRHTGDRLGQAWILTALGVSQLSLRQPERALDLCQQALAMAQDINEPQCEGYVLVCLGITYRHLRQYDNSIDCSQRATTIWRQHNNRYGLGWSLHSLGSVYRHIGKFDDAITHCREAAAIRHQISDRKGEASSLVSLGKALHHVQRLSEARQAWTDALRIFETIGDPKAVQLKDRIQILDTQLRWSMQPHNGHPSPMDTLVSTAAKGLSVMDDAWCSERPSRSAPPS